ncbi:MAG TPA: cyclic nucleotide-binding domain-containing protein, partial [Gemmatimonadaceae bacterium]
MSTASTRDRLRQAQFLDGTTESAIHQLAKLVSSVTYECDEMLFEEGSARTAFAIIDTGAVSIEKGQNGRPVRLVTLGAGQAVGEGLLLDELPHGTSARAIQRTEAFIITGDQVRELVKEHPTVYAALVGRAARSISQRLAATDATLVGHHRTLGFTGLRARKEHDLLGERDVPDEALYGVQTLRALEN